MLEDINKNLEKESPFKVLNNNFITADDYTDEEIVKRKDPFRSFILVIFFIVLIYTISSFIFLKILNKQLTDKKNKFNQLQKSREVDTFEKNLESMRDFSKKLKLVNSVYENRYFVGSMLLPLIENSTESSNNSYVYFNSFSFKKDIQNISKVSLTGTALDLQTLQRQIDRFSSTSINKFAKYFLNFKVDNIVLNEKENATFNFSFDVDVSTKSFIKYIQENIDLSFSTSSSIKNGVLFKKIEEKKPEPPATTNTNNTQNTIQKEQIKKVEPADDGGND